MRTSIFKKENSSSTFQNIVDGSENSETDFIFEKVVCCAHKYVISS